MEYIIVENGIITAHRCGATKPENAITVPEGFAGYVGSPYAALKADLTGLKPLSQQVTEGIVAVPEGYTINATDTGFIRMEQAEIDQKYPPKHYAIEGSFESITVRKTFDKDGNFGYRAPDGMTEMTGEQPGKACKAVNGQWVFDLPTGQAIKLDAVKTAFTEASAKAHCPSTVGFDIDANETANRDITGLINVLEATGVEQTVFRAYDNSFHEVTLTQLKTMLTEISLNGQYLYQAKWTLEAQIMQVQTEKELEAIGISADAIAALANTLKAQAMEAKKGEEGAENAETA